MVPDDTKLEAETRKEIDAKLEAAGWVTRAYSAKLVSKEAHS